MPQILFAFYWFLRLGPLALGAAAVAVLVSGYYLQVGTNERDAQKAAALAAGPPAAVEIDKFDHNQHATQLREVVVRAQPVFDMAYELTVEKNSGDSESFMVPLVSSTEDDEMNVVGIAFFHNKGFSFDELTPDFMMNGVVGFGKVGPIVEYNGKISTLGTWDDMTREAFAEQGLQFNDNLVVVWPFIDGRAAAFAPPKAGDRTVFGLFSKIAGAIGLLALSKLMFGSKPQDAVVAEMPAEHAIAPDPDTAPKASAAPLWKQRSGLVADDDDRSQPDAPETQRAASNISETEIIRTRSGFGLRKVLIGVVAAAFAVLLMATVYDLVRGSLANDQVAAIPTMQEQVAQAAADVIIPDADPNRHWTDIDVTPIIEWVTAQFFLAIDGDVAAQIIIGLLIVGMLAVPIGLRFYFTLRRTLRPKTAARFDSMGLN